MSAAQKLLEVRGLRAQYGPTKVLHGLDFEVAAGGITTILGANGAGKTTTLRAVCNMVRTEGEIVLAGTRIDGLATENIVRKGVAHVPDGRGTFLNLSVEENLRLGAYTRRDRGEVEVDYEHVYGYFPRLKERHKQQAGTLSGGEQQMLAIGRALLTNPRLLVLDEATEGLAPLVVAEIWRTIAAIRATGISTLIVDRNARAVLAHTDRAVILEKGLIVLEGTSATIAADAAALARHLGMA